MKPEITINTQYEYWLDFGEPEEARIIIPGNSCEEADQNYRKLIRHIFKSAEAALAGEKYDPRADPQHIKEEIQKCLKSHRPKTKSKSKPKRNGNPINFKVGVQNRMKILDAMLKGAVSLKKISEQTGFTTTNTSYHLHKLKKQGEVRQDSKLWFPTKPKKLPQIQTMVKPEKDHEYMQKQKSEHILEKKKKEYCTYCQTAEAAEGEDLCYACLDSLQRNGVKRE